MKHHATTLPGRFAFGQNWKRFLLTLNEERVSRAEQSLRQMLETEHLQGKSFLDVGSGSGLFSLAARRLGAKVHSFDDDEASVACTQELRRRYEFERSDWTIDKGSVLDRAYLNTLGRYDIVYAWGVLHHTGHLWEAMANVTALVEEQGWLFLAIYNDQGWASRAWGMVKRIYNSLPQELKVFVLGPAFLRLWGPTMLRDLLQAQPFHSWRYYARERGMSPWYDVIDWVGGYPFEVARPDDVFEWCRRRGFGLLKLKTWGGGHGCNEFVFQRLQVPRGASPTHG